MSTTSFANKIRSQNALILGGTSGVGLAVAAALLEQGVNVILSSSRQPKLDHAITSLKQAYPSSNIAGFVCDLAGPSVETNLSELLYKVTNHLSGTQLDHLIYTAGDALPMIPLDQVTLPKITSAIHVRAVAALLAVKTFQPLLKPSNTSSITLTSGSIANKPIAGGWSMLAFVGAGITGMTRQLAADLAPVRVNCVAPGVVDTDLWSGMSDADKQGMFEGLERSLPTGKVPTAEDLSESYVYLVRDRNSTGQIVHSNGGAFLI